MSSSKSVETEVALLKREVNDMKQIHHRLDSAIEKIADVSSSLHTIMAVHEEKLIRKKKNLEIVYKNYTLALQLTQKKLIKQ